MDKSRKQKVGARRARGPAKSAGVAVAYSTPLGPRPLPQVRSNGSSTRVSHTEAFDSVISTGTGFACASYAVNPGMGVCFPWLADIAARYETYKFRSLRFDYIPQVATSASGVVILAFDFDAQDPAPVTQFAALSYRDRASNVVWSPSSLQLDLAQGDKLPSKYTRVGAPIGSSYDLKTFDLGNLHVCVEGVAAATVGRLEVSYVVDLFTPQIQDPLGGVISSATGLDATHLFGTPASLVSDSQGEFPFTVTSSSVLTFNQQFEGMVYYEITGTVLSANFAPVASATGVTDVKNQIVNAAGTGVRGAFAIRAQKGTTLTPTITATTVTLVVYYFSRAAYASVTGY